MALIYLDAKEVLVIHAKIIDATGGAHGLRDWHLFQSALERPKSRFGGKALYPSLFDKTAVYFDAFARHHVFIDGNKRTAVAASARFLFRNGYELTAENKELEKFTLRVATKKLGLKEIALWLKGHTKRIFSPRRKEK